MTRSFLAKTFLVAGLALALAAGPARAQSEASLALSALPVASVVGAAGSAAAGAAAVSVLPAALAVSGAVLTVKVVEASALGTVYVLERASDGARASVRVSARAGQAVVLGVGTVVVVGALASGTLLSAAGEVLCFIPNEIGRALLHNERITY